MLDSRPIVRCAAPQVIVPQPVLSLACGSDPAAPVSVTVTAPVTATTAPVSVAAPVPVPAAPASVDAAPTTVPAVAAPAPAASQVPAVPCTKTDFVPLPQFSGDPEIVEKKLRGYIKNLLTNQVKGVVVATLRTQYNVNHCTNWVFENLL